MDDTRVVTAISTTDYDSVFEIQKQSSTSESELSASRSQQSFTITMPTCRQGN